MLKCTPLLGKYGTCNSDGHAFGRTLLRKEIKPLWNCVCFGEYHEYEIWHIFWKIKKTNKLGQPQEIVCFCFANGKYFHIWAAGNVCLLNFYSSLSLR